MNYINKKITNCLKKSKYIIIIKKMNCKQNKIKLILIIYSLGVKIGDEKGDLKFCIPKRLLGKVSKALNYLWS